MPTSVAGGRVGEEREKASAKTTVAVDAGREL
jgi:hypothetical protein